MAAKLDVALAHVEAGLRSRDRTLPEEHNGVIVDHVADVLLTATRQADANLAGEGIPGERIVFASNTMVDSLIQHVTETLDCVDFVCLLRSATAVVTDSTAIQEEATILGVSYFTLRVNAERPIRLTEGTNTLLGLRPQRIVEPPELIASRRAGPASPEGSDRRAGDRCASAIADLVFPAERPLVAA